MYRLLQIVLFSILVLPIFTVQAQQADAVPETSQNIWVTQCQGDAGPCEMKQSVEVKGAQDLKASYILGFPPKGKGEFAQGIIVLPLGILLPDGVTMRFEGQDDKSIGFDVRTCDTKGCYIFVTLPKEILDLMRTGSSVAFLFKSANGDDLQATFNLSTFKAVEEKMSGQDSAN